MTARILHLIPDSPFFGFTVDVFEAVAPGASTFLTYGRKGRFDGSAYPGARVIDVGDDAAGRATATDLAQSSDLVIAHSMTAFAAAVFPAVPASALRVWSGWGGDYYGSDFSRHAGQLGPKSAAYARSLLSPAGRLVQPLQRWRAHTPVRAAAAISDVFSAPIPDDLAVFRRRFPRFRGRYAQLNYATVEDSFEVGAHPLTGDDILLGNSATLANNHLEMLDLLAAAGVDGRRVVVPLSYGDAKYADAVVAHGRRRLGEAFVPLRDFMPLEEYRRVIADCSVVLMGHRRQQGVGNIAAALWNGAQVFLDERNPISAFLRARGATARTLGELAADGLPAARTSREDVARDRDILRAFWGRDVVLANTTALIASAGS